MKNHLNKSLIGLKRYAVVGTHPDGRARTVGPFWSQEEAKTELVYQRKTSWGWKFEIV